jgi:peptidyl-prolyl cis-trans isomerase SurA
VADYVDLFINYKLKVEAAKAARLDTMSSFQTEFAGYRDQQIRPAMVTDADVEAEARKIYTQAQQQVDGNGGLVKVAHILVLVNQKATTDQQKAAKVRAIYLQALQKGADFAELAKKVSQDPGRPPKGVSALLPKARR